MFVACLGPRRLGRVRPRISEFASVEVENEDKSKIKVFTAAFPDDQTHAQDNSRFFSPTRRV